MEPRTRFTMSLLLTVAVALTFVPAAEARDLSDLRCPVHGGVYGDVVTVWFSEDANGKCRVTASCSFWDEVC